MRPLSRSESILAGICSLLLLVATAGPPLALAHVHTFADQRMWLGVPNAADVFSNFGFALAGIVGLALMWRLPPRALDNVERAMSALFFIGLVLTAGASAWYHLHPDAAGLAIDRTGMAVAFAGLLGLATAGRVSARSGALLGLVLMVLAPLAIREATAGNVLPWAVVQFGGIGLLVWLAMIKQRPTGLDIRWAWVLAAYAVAKLMETQDVEIYQWTGGLGAGHALKHLMASLAAVPVISALWQARLNRQNGRSRTRGATASNAARA